MPGTKRTAGGTTVALVAVLLAAAAAGPPAPSLMARPVPATTRVAVEDPGWKRDTLGGRSGKLWMRLVSAERGEGVGVLRRLFGDSAAGKPGVYVARDGSGGPFAFVNLVPFTAKQDGRIGAYRLGRWPAEQRAARAALYRNPEGFIEVTPGNRDTQISEHFRLADFLTKDQASVWPKYLVLREELIDKLELLISELHVSGLHASDMAVMSGFRTPQYNQQGVGAGGRAQDSRHQYGDAADVFVDNDGNGRMDDLNGDGRINVADARVLAQAVERVEQRHAELVGGVGVYPATSTHGPFVHVDVRGVRARW